METTSVFEKYKIKPAGSSAYVHPLMLVPYEPEMEEKPLLMLRFDHRSGTRAFGTDLNQRIDCPYTHVVVTLLNPHVGAKSFSFGARRAIEETTTPERKEQMLRDFGAKNILRVDRLGKQHDLLKLVHYDLWHAVPGHIYPERDRLHDVCRVYALSADELTLVRRRIAAWKKKPPAYKIAGYTGPNCMTFALDLLEAAKLDMPNAWKWKPWPGAISRDIHKMAGQELHDMRKPNIFNVSAQTTEGMFHRAKEMLVAWKRKGIIAPNFPSVSTLARKAPAHTPAAA